VINQLSLSSCAVRIGYFLTSISKRNSVIHFSDLLQQTELSSFLMNHSKCITLLKPTIMKMKYKLILTILCFSIYVQAQIDFNTSTLSTATESETILDVISYNDFYYFNVQNFDISGTGVNIIQTDKDFQIINKTKNITIRGETASYNSLFKIANNKILMLSNATVDSKRYIYTYSLTLDLSKSEVIDSIQIQNNRSFYSYKFKNNTDDTFYAFGNIYSNGIAVNRSVDFIQIDTTGKIVNYKPVDGTDDIVLTFDFEPTKNIYYVSGLFNNQYLVDTSMTVIDSLFTSISAPNNNFIPAYSSDCNFIDSMSIECIANSPSSDEYSNMSVEYSIVDSILSINKFTPLHPLDAPKERTTVIIAVARDNELNYYFAYNSFFTPNDNIVSPNIVFISKFDRDLNMIFNLQLLNSNEYIILSSIIDNENALVVVGGHYPHDNPENLKNFYIRISETGEVLTNTSSLILMEKLDIYPNPCSDYINLNTISLTGKSDYFISSLAGQIVLQGTLDIASLQTINTRSLAAGTYILQVTDRNKTYVNRIVKID